MDKFGKQAPTSIAMRILAAWAYTNACPIIARTMPYEYAPLDQARQEIRILHFASYEDAIATSTPEYELRHVSLDDLPRYQTISYCWGDPTPCCTVMIGSQKLCVPRSSANVLEHLSTKRRTGQAIAIWIDAICINQGDINERAQQVQLMRRIYSQGSRNIIYLGEGDSQSLMGLENIRAFLKETSTWEEFPDHGLQTPINENALVALFSLPWFSRLWIIQEAVIAHENICILGDEEIDFDDVTEAIYAVALTPVVITSQMFESLSGMSCTMMIGRFREVITEGRQLELRYALTACKQSKSTDPRDKVFGVLGMHKDDGDEPEIRSLLTVDYTKSYQHVFRDATRFAIATTQPAACTGEGLEHILRWISHHNPTNLQDPDFPSWVPRFDKEDEFGDSLTNRHGFRMVGGNQEWYQSSEDPNVLKLRGHVLSRIAHISPTFEHNMFRGDMTQLSDMIRKIWRLVPKPRRVNKFYRTLLADNSYNGNPSTEGDWMMMRYMIGSMLQKPSEPTTRTTDHSNVSNVGSPEVLSKLHFNAFTHVCRDRRFIVTEHGEIGLAPRISQVGDTLIALLADCGGTPYVMRPGEGDHFKLVGACYLDGHMPGREDPKNNYNNAEYQWINIS